MGVAEAAGLCWIFTASFGADFLGHPRWFPFDLFPGLPGRIFKGDSG